MRLISIFFIFCFFSPIIWGHNDVHQHLIYIENKGQWHGNVLFKTDIQQGAIFLEKTKLTVHVSEHSSHKFDESTKDKPSRGHVYTIDFVGANPYALVVGNEKREEYFNYFLDKNPANWKGNCAGYEEVIYKNIYPFIDLKINSKNFQPKYTFVLRHGAKISDIKMKFSGLSSIYLDQKGDLISKTVLGEIKDEKPISFLYEEGNIKTIESQFKLIDTSISFDVKIDEIKKNQTLEIDPQIIFSSYSGSTADNFGSTATYDNAGNLYGAGTVFGQGYVTTIGAYQTTFGGNADIAITKFNPTGSARLYSTYIGGSDCDAPHSLIVDQNNRLILLATTSSTNYPITSGAFKTTFSGGTPISLSSGLGLQYNNGVDIAVTKFNTSGSALVASTYFGGNGTDGLGNHADLVKNYGDNIRGEVEIDTFGNIYIASLTTSTNLPTLASSAKATNSGGYDGILVKFNTNLTTMLGFTYVGGSGQDALYDMCFDDAGNIVAAGGTSSSNLGATTGVVNSTYSGLTDGMVVSFNNNLSALRFASYYGTSDYDQIYFVETDRTNKIYLFGQTTHATTNYYLLGALFSNPHKGQFVSILNPNMTTKIKSTTFGAGNQDPDISPTAFLVDYCDKIFITGWGTNNMGSTNVFNLSTTGLPITANAFQSTTMGTGFYMMILEGDLSAQYYGSYFGGKVSSSKEHVDGGTSRFDKNGIVYHAVCAGCSQQQNYPIYPNAASVVGPSNNSSNCNLGVFKFDFGLPVNADFSFSASCAPATVLFTNLSHTVTPTGAKFYWLFGNGATSILKNPTITFSSPGIYSARLIIVDSASCNIADTMIKSVLILGTTADTLTDKVICPGSSIKIGFSGINDTGLTINWSPTSTLDDPTILSPFASPSVTTQYRLILTKTGCTDTFYQKVIVELPKPLVIKGDSVACLNSLTPYTCNNYTGGSYDWLPKGNLTSSNRDTAKFTFTSLPKTITVSYTSPNGCISSTSKTIIQGIPNIKLTADSIVCKGDIVTVIKQSNIANSQITLSPLSSVISFIADTIRVKVDTSMKFYAIIALSPSCTARDSISFKLLKDKLNWSVDSILCANQLVSATATSHPAYTYSWQPSATLTTAQGVSPAQFNLSNTSRYVSIHAIHAQRALCQFHDSAKVKFIDSFITLRADTTKCRDSTVTIYHGNARGAVKTWSPIALLISQTDSSATFKVSNTQYFKLTITDNSCIRSDSIRIRVINDYVKITGDTVVCPKDTATLQVTNMTGATYLWLPSPTVLSGLGTSTVQVRVNTPQWFYVHVQDTNQCYIIDSFFVNNFDSTKSVKSNFVATTNCQNLLVNFTNKSRVVGSTPTYLWDFGGQGTSTILNPTFSFTSFGLQTIKLIVNDPVSCNLTDTVPKLIYILHNAKTTLPEIKSCKGDTVNIGLESMVDNAATITWTPSAGLVNANTFYPKVRLYTTTTFTAIISKNGCVDTLIQKVNIDSPNAIKLRGDTVACLNSELRFTTDKYSVGSYIWSPFSQISYQNRDTAKMMITGNNQWIKVIYLSDYGCKSPDSLLVKTMLTTLNLQMDSLGCKNEVLTMLYKPVPRGGVLTYNPSSNMSLITDSSARYTVDTTKLFSVQYKINNNCIATQIVNFKLLKDAVSWKTDSLTCRNSTVISTANMNNRWSLNWTPPSLLQTVQGISPARFGNFVADSKIYIQSTLTNRPACIFRDSALVRLFENTIKIKGKLSNCKDSFIALTANFIPNTTYTWSPTNALFNSNVNNAIFKTDISRYYYVSAQFNGQCTAIDSHFVLTGNPSLKLYSDTIICTNDTVTLNATLLAGATYLWSNGAVTNSTRVRVTQPTTYYVNVVDSNNCNLRDSLSIKIFDKSMMKFFNRDSVVCKFDTVKLEVNKYANVTYQWVPSQFILSGNGTNKIKAWINQNITFYFNAFLNRGEGCFVIDSIGMIKDTQYLKIAGNRLVCKGDTLTLMANQNANFIYNWTPTSWVVNLGNIIKYKIIDSAMIYCRANSSLFPKCLYRDSVKVDYSRDLDKLRVTADPDRVEFGSSTTLRATAPNIVDYFWTPKKTLSNQFVPSPTAKPDTTTTYYVQVENNLGCRGGDSVIVTVYYEDCGAPEIFIPTGFTPNKDGKNDALYVRGDNIVKMQLMIYDRWGQLVFESNNQKKGWDGTYKGVELEPTVYAYYLSVQCVGGASYSQKGNITLIK
jgi:gliding motility-associated-like protein